MTQRGSSPVASQFPTLFFLLGPTAVGKTNFAVEVAEQCDAEIIGADAFQIYEGLPILTAKPAPAMLSRVPHHLVGEIPREASFNVAQYIDAAANRITDVVARGKRPLVVGGTGLYVRALTQGLADLPSADTALREELQSIPLEELQRRFAQLDPAGALQIDMKNPRRVIRALEVCLVSGKPFSSHREQWDKPNSTRGVILSRERDELYDRINERVLQMFREGVVDEVRSAGPLGLTAQQALGVREIQSFLAGTMTEDECIAAIQQETRRYAKRQLTWFRREKNFTWTNLTNSDVRATEKELVESINDRVL